MRVFFLGSNLHQANSSYTIQAKVPARSKSMISSRVFFWVHNEGSMYFFGCKILGTVRPPVTFKSEYPPWDLLNLSSYGKMLW